MGWGCVQMIWQLLNLCMLGFVLALPGSSGLGKPISLESHFSIPPLEAQAPHSRFKQVIPSSKLPPFLQNGHGVPPVPSPTQFATLSLEHGFATSPPTQAPLYSAPLVTEMPHYSTSPPVTESAHALVMVSSGDTTPSLVADTAHVPTEMAPPVLESAHEPSTMVLPEGTTQPPVTESVHEPSPMVTPPLDTIRPPVVALAHVPSAKVPSVDKKSPQLFPPDTHIEIPSFLPTPPPYQTVPIVKLSPVSLPVLSAPSQMGPPQDFSPTALASSNTSVPPPVTLSFPLQPPHTPSKSLHPANKPTLYEALPPAGDTPHLKLRPPFSVTPSHKPPQLPGAEPPYASSLPLAANPPNSSLLFPSVPPSELQPVFPSLSPTSALQSPPMTLNESPPPSQLAPPIALSPIAQLSPVNASSTSPMFQNASTSPPSVPVPSIVSSAPPQLTPPITSSPSPPRNPSSPVLPLIPQFSPPTPAVPPSSSVSPPLIMSPPIDSTPEIPSPPESVLPPSAIPPPSVPPTLTLPPSSSFSPPLIVPPLMDSPPQIPSPPELVIPWPASPSASVLPTPTLPPSSSLSPLLIVPPPMEAPPQLTSPSESVIPPPPSPPASVLLTPTLPPSSPFSPSLSVPPPTDSPPQSPSPHELDIPPSASPPSFVLPMPTLPPSSSFSPPFMVPSPLESPPHLPSPPKLVTPPPSPPIFMLPTPTLPPSSSLSPPLVVPPPTESPPDLPALPPTISHNASSLPPQINPPHTASSPSHLVVPPSTSPATSLFPPFASPPTMMPSSVSPSTSLPMPSHVVSPLPQLVPPLSNSTPFPEPPQMSSAPPPINLPSISPPSSPIVPGAIPPRSSALPHFLSPPLAFVSPPSMVPSHYLFVPPPSGLSYPSVPPPVFNRTVPASPPHSSQRKVTQHGAPPPLLTLPETSPPPGTPTKAQPPFQQVMPESPPPVRKPVEAPKRSTPSSSLNASEPQTPPQPAPAPAPSNEPDDGTASQPLPSAPEQSTPSSMSRIAPSEPEFERQNGSAPAPSFQVNPSFNGSHHSRNHSSGAPIVVAPLPQPQGIHEVSPRVSPFPGAPPGNYKIPFISPEISPSGSLPRVTKRPVAPPTRSLPPPPPNADCAYLTCPEPTTNTPPGSPCGCVWPMQVGMRLSVALYTFFPLVSELAQEIANGVFLKQCQVRVMGANATNQEAEKTIVLVDLIPLDEKFDNITSHLIFDRFWNKQVVIDRSIFGDYDILYVRYPGLPPSPPMAPADIAVINGMPYSVGDPNGNKLRPLGVDVTKQRHKHRLNAIIIAVMALSAVLGVLMCCSLAWILVFRPTNNNEQPTLTPCAVTSLTRSSGPTGVSTGSGQSSPLSLGSSLATYTGSAKTFSGREIEKATDNFNPSRILGEGGFGLVYRGNLDDETRVAVKVLKRDDQQGAREFLAEVEMLSRLHHRNLVKLIGICTDERMRCLVYELIPNGSVDSHLHGADREVAPLDWASRLKIALGAARGLAYLHEDSSPRVIHRDFKSSNILLENDFAPKVSDFGLARSALDEENQHISTRVMGTFGYVAPEYAMTGHLLVKSDVYSYGVVLLELLTGRKPVDMSQPAGQENLVAWTRPLLTTKEGLESIIDPSLGSEVPFESVAKVAAIASMCVQPEVSHRPFMGEVVQALKLVCSECDDSKDGDSRSLSRENLSVDFDAKLSSTVSGTLIDPLPGQFSLPNYAPRHDVEKGLSVSETFSTSASLDQQPTDSFRRRSASGPLKAARGLRFWQRIKGQPPGSVSEHGIMYRLWAGSH